MMGWEAVQDLVKIRSRDGTLVGFARICLPDHNGAVRLPVSLPPLAWWQSSAVDAWPTLAMSYVDLPIYQFQLSCGQRERYLLAPADVRLLGRCSGVFLSGVYLEQDLYSPEPPTRRRAITFGVLR